MKAALEERTSKKYEEKNKSLFSSKYSLKCETETGILSMEEPVL